MIHYTCDMCGKAVGSRDVERFRVLIDVEQRHPGEDDSDLDNEYQDYDDFEFEPGEEEEEEEEGEERFFRSFKFDLCRECAEIYVQDPLSRKVPRRMRFLDN